MITLLLGQDIYAKQEFLDQIIQSKKQVSVSKYVEGQDLPLIQELSSQSLFGESVAHVFSGCLSEMDEQYLDELMDLPNSVFILEENLDKRTQKARLLLENTKTKKVIKKEFEAPNLDQATQWIMNRAKILGAKIEKSAATTLANYAMGQTGQVLPVVRTNQELLKLKSLADGEQITTEMVESLVLPEEAIDVFALTDAISQNRKSEAIGLLIKFYQNSNEDEKSSSIKLVALLAEQWRSLLITKDFVQRGATDQQILTQTGWKSGRLFIMKKLARNIDAAKLLAALNKLSHLDNELKTSTLPSRVIVDMIISSLS